MGAGALEQIRGLDLLIAGVQSAGSADAGFDLRDRPTRTLRVHEIGVGRDGAGADLPLVGAGMSRDGGAGVHERAAAEHEDGARLAAGVGDHVVLGPHQPAHPAPRHGSRSRETRSGHQLLVIAGLLAGAAALAGTLAARQRRTRRSCARPHLPYRLARRTIARGALQGQERLAICDRATRQSARRRARRTRLPDPEVVPRRPHGSMLAHGGSFADGPLKDNALPIWVKARSVSVSDCLLYRR
jgi:hypothetical protein